MVEVLGFTKKNNIYVKTRYDQIEKVISCNLSMYKED
jgi:hypothetical protein